MSVGTWLKTFGVEALRDAALVLGVAAGDIKTIAPTSAAGAAVSDTLTDIATIITDVETEVAALTPGSVGAAGAAPISSAQKLQMASARANERLQKWYAANMPGNPAVIDKAAWQTGVATLVNGMVSILNSADGKAVQVKKGVAGSSVPSAALTAAIATPSAPAK